MERKWVSVPVSPRWAREHAHRAQCTPMCKRSSHPQHSVRLGVVRLHSPVQLLDWFDISIYSLLSVKNLNCVGGE